MNSAKDMGRELLWHERLVTGRFDGRIDVTFWCRYWSKEVCVEMLSPYPGERMGTHMPYLVPTRFGEESGCIDWQSTAWGLVREIIEREEWKASHRAVYERRREESRQMLEGITLEVESLKSQLDKLRRNRKDGWVSAILYGSKVEPIKKDILEWEALAFEENEGFWLRKLMGKDRFVK